MANQILTSDQIVSLVQRQTMERNIPLPHVSIDEGWCPARLYIGTYYASLPSASLMLTEELFAARVVRPLLDRVIARQISPPDPNELWRDANKAEFDLLDQRGTTHGDYTLMCSVIQDIKRAMRRGTADLQDTQREALELIATKIGRIVCGDPNHPDHWDDIIGYATKARERIAVKK